MRENGDGTETAFQVTLGEEAGNALLPMIRKAHAAGVDFVSYLGYEPPWREDGDDWSSLDTLTEAIVGENPGALLVPRVYVDAPKWWLERNPEHRMQFAAEHADAPGEQNRLGHCIRPDMASVSSRDYRAAASAYLRRFCRHMIEKYPRNFAGIHPAAQNSHEFFYFDSWNRMSGYDPQTLAAWRKWTGDATAVVPSASERLALVGQAPILDAASQMQCIEFNRFLQAEMADFAAEMAHACREATLGRSLVLLFYGYSWEFSPHQLGPANSGHYGLERLLKEAAGDIDILCAPISYWDRGRLGSSPRMAAAETVMRSGVLWLNEDDSRTYRDVRVAEYVHEGSKVSLPQSRMVLLRNTAQEVLCGYGSWWMDLSGLGWYDSEELWSIQRALMPLEKALLARSRRFEPEFALVVDEESMIQLSGGTTALCAPLVKGARAEAARCGAPYGQYLLADVCRNPPKAKLQVFQSCWSLSNEKLESLVLQREAIPAVRVWCWAPGWRDGDGRPDTDRMTRLTGFQFQTLASPIEGAVFTVNEESADEVLDRFPDGSPSLAIRRRGDGADVFVAKPGDLNASLLHRLAELAGVHLFLQGGEVGKATLCFAEIDEGEYVLEIQALEATTLHLRFPGGGQIVDALDGRILGTGPDIAVDFGEGEVRVLKSARKESQRDDSSSRP